MWHTGSDVYLFWLDKDLWFTLYRYDILESAKFILIVKTIIVPSSNSLQCIQVVEVLKIMRERERIVLVKISS